MIKASDARLAENSADAGACYEAARDLTRVRAFGVSMRAPWPIFRSKT